LKRPRGRPKGHKLSQASKNKIANSKRGHPHNKETKGKIAKSLVKYFDKKGRKRPMAHARGVNPGEHDPNTLELNKSFMECGQLLRGLLKDSGMELISVTITGAMGLDGGEKQSEYFSDDVDGIKGTKFIFSMRKRAFYEISSFTIPGEHFRTVIRNMVKKYPTLPLRVRELTIRHKKSGNIYATRVYGYIRKQVDRRQLLVIKMNSKKHTHLSRVEYGTMLDDLISISIRQCYFEYQMTRAAKLCSIIDLKKAAGKKKKKSK